MDYFTYEDGRVRTIRWGLAGLLLLTGFGHTVRGDDLSRWVRVAQAPRLPQTAESIATPGRTNFECPTLEELGHRSKNLLDVSLNVELGEKRIPGDCSTVIFHEFSQGGDGRTWDEAEFYWAASDLFAQPAYFDDPVLERYGQAWPPIVQPWLSGVHFFGQFPLMPYKLLIDQPFDHVYTLGYYRAGSPHPCVARRLVRP